MIEAVASRSFLSSALNLDEATTVLGVDSPLVFSTHLDLVVLRLEEEGVEPLAE